MRQIKILFLAWGFSVHAKRRIQIFTSSNDYSVKVVANYNYQFERAENVLLESAATVNARSLSESRVFASIALMKNFAAYKILLKLILFVQEIFLAFKDYVQIKKEVSLFNPDIIFLQTLLYPCFLALFLPKKTPKIVTFWNGDLTWWAKWHGIERLLKKYIVMIGVRKIEKITLNSQAAYEACISLGGNPDKISLFHYPGVDLSVFKKKAVDPAFFPADNVCFPVIICPRGIGGYLNTDTVLYAIPIVKKVYPHILFVFIGPASAQEQEKFFIAADDLGIKENVKYVGVVPWEMMPSFYNISNIMISISSNDSLPNCMLEAMACEVPIIMGDIPQIRYWIKDKINGCLINPVDQCMLSEAILFLLENPHTKETIVKNNIELVRANFDQTKNEIIIKNLVRQIVLG